MPLKSDQLYNELKQLAEKLGIEVSERNFRPTGIAVKSGYCRVKGSDLFLIDKHIKLNRKIEVLAEHLAQQPLESIYVLPVVREYLEQYVEMAKRAAVLIEQGPEAKEDVHEDPVS